MADEIKAEEPIDLEALLASERTKSAKLEADLARAIADSDQRANNIAIELDAATKALASVNADKTALQTQLDQAKARCAALEADCTGKATAIAQLNSKIETNGRLMIERDRIVQQQAQLASQNAELNRQRQALEQQINS